MAKKCPFPNNWSIKWQPYKVLSKKKQLVFYLTRVAVSKERFLSVCIFEKAESVATFVPNFLNLNDVFDVGMTICGGDIAFGFSCGSKRFKILWRSILEFSRWIVNFVVDGISGNRRAVWIRGYRWFK